MSARPCKSLFALAAFIIGSHHAAADGLAGFYAGAEIGESQIAATGELIETPSPL